MNVITTCPFCNTTQEVEVPAEAMERYHNGALIQDALHMLTAEERELIKTGICTSCWDNNLGDC
jgi:hypothetical protein